MGRKDDQSASTADPFGFDTGGFDAPVASKSSKAPSDPFGFGTGGFDPIVEPEKPRTGWDTAKDVGVEIMAGGAGAVGSVQGLLNWATGREGEEKFDADFISSAKEYWQDMKSDYRKQRDAELASAMSDPNKSIVEHLIENPAEALMHVFHWLDNDGRALSETAERSRALGRPDAASRVADRALEVARGGARPVTRGLAAQLPRLRELLGLDSGKAAEAAPTGGA